MQHTTGHFRHTSFTAITQNCSGNENQQQKKIKLNITVTNSNKNILGQHNLLRSSSFLQAATTDGLPSAGIPHPPVNIGHKFQFQNRGSMPHTGYALQELRHLVNCLGIPGYSDRAIAANLAYFAKMRISHIFLHIMAFSKFRIFIYAFRISIYAYFRICDRIFQHFCAFCPT